VQPDVRQRSLSQKPLPAVATDPGRYHLCLLGPLALGLSVGIQSTITAFLLWGAVADPGLADRLTDFGKTVVRPEHDLLIYIAGAAFTLFMSWLTVWYWRGKLAEIETSRASGFMTASAVLEGVYAATSLIVFALLLSGGWFSLDFHSKPSVRPEIGGFDAVRLLVPAVMALLCVAVDLESGLGQSAGFSRSGERYPGLGRILRYATPIFILLVVGVPPDRWRYLAGQFFGAELLQHMGFFVMGPALSFTHGKAFGSEFYSQYGVGWPLLASALSRFSALTYANLAGMEIVYGCIYYVALFFLLRICFKQEVWAALGVVLAIYWQIFSGIGPADVIWQFPSSTMMRHPLDVWFFLALVMHQRSGKTFWAGAAGFAGALGVLFETETGIYLLVTFIIYAILRAGLAPDQGRPNGGKGLLASVLVFFACVAAILLPLLLYASRGTLFTSAFLRGWLEALFLFGSSGVGALPIAELPDAPLVFFLIMLTVYLGVIAYAIIRGLHRSATGGEVLLATLAAYGMAVLLLFVGRSHPFNLCHAAPPFAVLLTALLSRCYSALPGSLQKSALPHALTAGLALLLLTKPSFQIYPSLVGSLFQSPPIADVSLRAKPLDMSGLPPSYEGFARETQDLCSTIHTLAPDGKDVAILDLNDTMLYSVADACPWSRYSPLFYMVLTPQALENVRHDLAARPPKYVVMRGQNSPRPSGWDFVWAPLYEAVKERYGLQQTVGSYEIWLHRRQP
jgi:hypothetical protein